ncbi:hypothetical protein [Pseudomonas sp. NPDC087639]|uniref:hypothetical protein n=1 Tax=Pseudomonas sp. NPDC087639 TaxID=3364445 RepID=UPI00380A0EB6
MSKQRKKKDKGVLLADAPKVDDVPESDPDGKVPAKILMNGGVARVPRWPIYAPVGESDLLEVFWRRDGVTTTIYSDVKPGPITETEFIIPLDKSIFQGDGVAYLYYRQKRFPVGNPLTSEERKLTIDHSVIPLPVLKEPRFPDVNFDGYLNCTTLRPIWEGVYVKVPFQNLNKDDICELSWRGYSNLNNSEDFFVEGSAGGLSYTLSQADADNKDGFELPPIPFSPYLEDLINKCCVSATYKIRSAGDYIGKSLVEIAKIDRAISGDEYCGPPRKNF